MSRNQPTPRKSVQQWQDEAMLRQQSAARQNSQEVCPLSQTRIAEIERQDLFLASDDHLYDRSYLVAYARENWVQLFDPPKSPLTGRRLQPLDLARLCASPENVASLEAFSRRKEGALQRWNAAGPALFAVSFGAFATAHVSLINDEIPPVVTSVAKVTVCVVAAALVGLSLHVGSFCEVFRNEFDYLQAAHVGLYRERLQRYTASMDQEERRTFALALKYGRLVLLRTMRGTTRELLRLEREVVNMTHEQRTRFVADRKPFVQDVRDEFH